MLSHRQKLNQLESEWRGVWPQALALWSPYTQLAAPVFCRTRKEAQHWELDSSFAMIRFRDHVVVINLEDILARGLQDYALEILAHEIGHHVLVPANLTDHTRMLARIRVNLPTVEQQAPMVANLFSDLLINNHLQRQKELRLDAVYQQLNQSQSASKLWHVYLRIYEILWQTSRGELGANTDESMDADAWLGARIVKVYATDWLVGAQRFACLLLPYLVEEKMLEDALLASLMDTQSAGAGAFPHGLTGLLDDNADTLHPSQDPVLVGQNAANPPVKIREQVEQNRIGGQTRELFAYGEILRAAGVILSDHDIAIRFYKERALPLLIDFPSPRQPKIVDSYPEGTYLWEPGDPLENIDWFSTLSQSSSVIPGVTTLQRQWGLAPGAESDPVPVDLDLYVDCSGSMPNPQQEISYTALAGAILALSALRAGAAVQVTLWSGKQQFQTSNGFVRVEKEVLSVLTAYLGGATAFPIHMLRKTYIDNQPPRPCHIVVLSDDGVTTMFNEDEQGQSGWDIAQQALTNAKGGGTLVLNLPWQYPDFPPNYEWLQKDHDMLLKAEQTQGWNIYTVNTWEAMLAFAKGFSEQQYQEELSDGDI